MRPRSTPRSTVVIDPSDVRIEPLAGHDRSAFDCGVRPLDVYFQRSAGQDSRRRVANVYVALVGEVTEVAAFYTLSACGVPRQALPPGTSRRLPRYDTLPAVLMGRLAVDRRWQGQGLGGILIVDAVERVRRSGIGAIGLLVDAKDPSAADFYDRHGFDALTDDRRTLFRSCA